MALQHADQDVDDEFRDVGDTDRNDGGGYPRHYSERDDSRARLPDNFQDWRHVPQCGKALMPAAPELFVLRH